MRRICTKSQEKVDLGSGQTCGADRRSGSVCGSNPELGRAQGRFLGLGLDNQVAPSPSPNRWPSLIGLDSIDPTRLKATGMGIRPSQGPLPRPFMPYISKSLVIRVINVGKEGNVTHIWEEGELIEGSAEEYDCVDMHRYGDNLYE